MAIAPEDCWTLGRGFGGITDGIGVHMLVGSRNLPRAVFLCYIAINPQELYETSQTLKQLYTLKSGLPDELQRLLEQAGKALPEAGESLYMPEAW